jgi:hypothetical protein
MSDLCSQATVQKARASRVSQLAGALRVSYFAFKTSQSLVLELGLEVRGLYIVPSIQDTRYVSKHSYGNTAESLLYSVGCIQAYADGHQQKPRQCRQDTSGRRPRVKVLRLKVDAVVFSILLCHVATAVQVL